MSEVVTFGESMARLTGTQIGPLRLSPSLNLGIAGAESNFSIGLARLGASAGWIGRVGDDEFGRLIVATLRSEGVNVHDIVDTDAGTGILVKHRRNSMLTEVEYFRSGSAGSRLRASDLDAELISNAKVLHVTGITPALSPTAREACFAAVEIAQAAGVTISFDLNMRWKLWDADEAAGVLRDLVRRANIVFASEAEAEIIVHGAHPAELANALRDLGPDEAVIKRGADGAYALTADEELEAPKFTVLENDPVGAGDAFCAGYVYGWVRGFTLEERLRLAAVCGASVVMVPGDWEGLPTQKDLASFTDTDVRR